jgi:translation initiation factor IF-3
VRLIGEKGEQLGILPLQRAVQMAWERGLDLVEVAPTANPPVCRILDYGKYKYEQARKERRVKRGQRVGLLKEIRLRPSIGEHDLQSKIRTTKKLLQEGSKVKVVVRFRGREVIYPELGRRVLHRVTGALNEVATVSDHVTEEARSIALILYPVSTGKPKEEKPDAKDQDS